MAINWIQRAQGEIPVGENGGGLCPAMVAKG